MRLDLYEECENEILLSEFVEIALNPKILKTLRQRSSTLVTSDVSRLSRFISLNENLSVIVPTFCGKTEISENLIMLLQSELSSKTLNFPIGAFNVPILETD